MLWPNIAHVVWVGKSEPDIAKLQSSFTVRKDKVVRALRWLHENHEDYKNVTIDEEELNKWPSVFITEALLKSIGRVRNGSSEEAARDGFAVENTNDIDRELPSTVSAVLNTNNIDRPQHLQVLQELASLSGNTTINVVTGNNILQTYEQTDYFTSAFPTLFPWGTGKHLDSRRPNGRGQKLTLKKWTQLLLQNSSRYMSHIYNCCTVY
jgi:hypothetical protein